MTGICDNCGRRHRVPGHRGSRLADMTSSCCNAQMHGPNRGRARAAGDPRPQAAPAWKSAPDAHLRCRTGRHAWIDETARLRCCDPAWEKLLVDADELSADPDLQYAGRSAVPGIVYAWRRARTPELAL